MADFQTSTHRGKWIFSEHELQLGKRDAANKRAKKMIEKYGTTRLEVDIDGSLSYPEPLNELKNDAEHHSLPKALKCEEEQLMRVFYEQKIQEVCGAFRFPRKIQATAIIYFKRFYLQWSVMEHQPKHIMLTCIYASCKVEENHVSAEELGKGIQQDPQIILNNEMIVLQSLGFDLIVYAPYRSIDGFIEDMKEFFQATYDDQMKYTDLAESAKSEVDRIMLTDAPLLFSPGQLALVALHMSNNRLRAVDLKGYVGSVVFQDRGDRISELDRTITAIDILLGKLAIPSAKEMRHIDRKLKHCWDPSSHDNNKKEKRSKHKSKRKASEMDGDAI